MAGKTPTRFTIRTPAGEVEPIKNTTYNERSVLSRAITLATAAEEPGVWDVVEWEDVLFRVHRLPSTKLDVRIEVAA